MLELLKFYCHMTLDLRNKVLDRHVIFKKRK
jgi:hypothetical protein